jgi:hypothetical protein
MKTVLLWFSLLFISITVSATPNSKIYIFHINGINTSIEETISNAEALKNAAAIDSDMTSWDFLYNQSHGLWDDLEDVFQQKAQEDNPKITLDDYVTAYFRYHDLDYPPDSADYAIVKAGIKDDYLNDPQFFGSNFEELLTQFHQKLPPPEQQRLAEAARMVKSYAGMDNNVLFIPHSQGNLYANSLISYLVTEELFPPTQISNFGIASPANTVINGRTKTTSYVTSSKDLVINGLRILRPALNSNVSLGFSWNDPLGHNLIDVYLAESASRTRINQEIHNNILNFTSLMVNNQQKYHLRFALNISDKDRVMLKGGNKIICDNQECAEDLLYYRNNVGTIYLASEADYPQGNNYTLLSQVNNNNPFQIRLAATTNVALNRLLCYTSGSEEKSHYDCYKSRLNTTQDTISAANSNISNLSYAQNKYPELFENGLLVGREFYY